MTRICSPRNLKEGLGEMLTMHRLGVGTVLLRLMICSLIRVIFVAIPAVALAQGGPGPVGGRVSDSQQLALSRAVIELEDSGGHIVQKVVADETGHYKIDSVSPASYTVSFSAVGFEPSKEGPVTLTDHQAVLLDAILQPRQVLESITVRAENDQLVASMTDIPLGTLPVTVQTVTRESIKQQNATEIVTALNNVPGADSLPALIAW
jgi:hypothetical protein